jgi:vitamin-K-epoxide reductase (warfarin-sensitive)
MRLITKSTQVPSSATVAAEKAGVTDGYGRTLFAMAFLRYLIALLAVGGMVVSGLALRVHLQDPNAAPPCAVTEKWDCGAVNHSRFAVFPAASFGEDPRHGKHIPVAVLGLGGYLLIAVLALTKLDFFAFEAAQVGLFFAGILSYLEAFVLEKWCIYCVWSQTIIAVITVVAAINYLVVRNQRKLIY